MWICNTTSAKFPSVGPVGYANMKLEFGKFLRTSLSRMLRELLHTQGPGRPSLHTLRSFRTLFGGVGTRTVTRTSAFVTDQNVLEYKDVQ